MNKFRIDEMRAALGPVQLFKLEEFNLQRRRIVERYIGAFQDIDGLIIPFANYDQDTMPVFHIFPVLLPERCNRQKVIE